MIKKLLLTLSLFVNLSFGNSETISLTGDFAKNDLGNPFRALLEKKDKSISIFSENKDVSLKVETDLRGSSKFSGFSKDYPTTLILNNSSVQNVLKVYYSEEYKVEVKEKADVIVNVLGGKIELEHFFDDDKNIRPILKKIIVNLNVEIIKNGIKTTQNITLDDKLGKEDTSYKWTMREDTFKRNPLSLSKNVPQIIENQIYILKGL
ncbi:MULTISPECIES: hypothetical protein [Aliarcobacter]|uniref:hypothetical protein n=1 Tax=Aliarcobacter TaxID=2321111 RepID=UPI0021B39837|nr:MULTISPECIES: hypothetical protein [Aliarcobacter]MCT7544431.1 hypothetical protein [Aliarcobacter cryaerophilus]MCT7578508.1 hypothetical protein [Aliarcobacter butzleri]